MVYKIKYNAHDDHISLEKCPATVFLTSTGLTKTHQSLTLGKYSEDGTSNGRISYRHAGGYYLQFIPGGQWTVSANYIIPIAIPVKFLVKYHSINWDCQVIEFTVFYANTENRLDISCF